MKIGRANGFGIPLFLAFAGLGICWRPGTSIAAERTTNEIKIRVINVVTHARVTGAKVSVRGEAEQRFRDIGVTSNGLLQFSPIGDDQMIEVHVEANGFRDRTALLTLDNPQKLDVTEIELYPAEFWVRGVVSGPGGQLAPDAQMAFIVANQAMALEANAQIGPGKFEPLRLHSATGATESDGKFGLMAPPATSAMVVVHALGSASIPMIGWTNGTTILLRPWTPLRGRMIVNGKPAANRNLVAVACSFFDSNARLYLRNFETTTDANGRFVFDRLPAGMIDVVQKLPMAGGRQMYSHGMSFVIDAILPATEVVYELNGRDIRGTVVLDGNKPVDWRGLTIIAMLVRDGAVAIDEFVPLAGGATSRPRHSFALSMNGDGEFSATTIPPGEYIVNVNCFDQYRPSAEVRGKVVVPAGDGPIVIAPTVVTNMPLRNLRLAK